MKNIFNKLLLVVGLAFLVGSCEKDDDFATLNQDASTTLSLSKSEVILDLLNEGQNILTINWTAPEYGFNAAPRYSVEFIANNKTESVSVGNNLTKTFETVELNRILINLGMAEGIASNVTIIVKAILSDVVSINSNSLILKATPYKTTFPPIYMIGAALKGWDTAKAVEVNSIGPKNYEVIAKFTNNETFRFFEAADWGATSYNYVYFTGGEVDTKLVNGEDGDKNLRFVGETGFYKIGVNLVTKTITMTAVDEPVHYIVGAGVPDAGWGWSTPIKMTWIKDGVFEATTKFSNDTFRFFTKFNDWGSGLNYPYYISQEFVIDSKFENGNDGDKNFKFNGTPGIYTVKIDYLAKKITLTN